jgi:hypothetical protein
MDLTYIWDDFIDSLRDEPGITSCFAKKIAGIPFLYVETELDREDVEYLIRKRSARAMRGKRLHSHTIFFRSQSSLYVYRHRFYVPQEKMFCCGNLCVDCVRLKQ